MATALQQQLAVIAANSTHQLDLKAQKSRHSKSLLVEPRDAATQNFDEIFQLCYEGFQELCVLDSRFIRFENNLFSEQSKDEDRTQLTATENAELDAICESFLGLVCGRLLLVPAMKAVEWLVRRFRIQEYNTEYVLLTFLPYHTSHIFSTLMAILPGGLPASFKFLAPYVASLQSPPRHAILSAIINNAGFFCAFSQYVLKVAKSGHQSAILLGFWASVTAQAVNGMIDVTRSGRENIRKQREEDLLLRVLPILDAAIRIKDIPELYLGTCMIITVIATKISIQDDVVDALMQAVVQGWTKSVILDALSCLAILADAKQRIQLSRPVADALLEVPDAWPRLSRLASVQSVSNLVLMMTFNVLETRTQPSGTGEMPRLGNDNEQFLKFLFAVCDRKHYLTLLDEVARKMNVDLRSLQLPNASADESDGSQSPKNELMPFEPDANVKIEFSSILEGLPSTRQISFLDSKHDSAFEKYRDAWRAASSSAANMKKLTSTRYLDSSQCINSMAFMTMMARLCTDQDNRSKIKALEYATTGIESVQSSSGTDFQVLVPYALTALTDRSQRVRKAAAELCLAISKQRGSGKMEQAHLWGKNSVYGECTNLVRWQTTEDSFKLLKYAILPELEECVLDCAHIRRHLIEVLRTEKAKELKKSGRQAACAYLASHARATPVVRMRVFILQVIGGTAKIGNEATSRFVVPLLKEWAAIPEQEAKQICDAEHVGLRDLDKALADCISHRSAEELKLLESIVVGTIECRVQLISLFFERLRHLWNSMAAPAQLKMTSLLLDLALRSTTDSDDEAQMRGGGALEVLRNVALSTDCLIYMIEALPKATDLRDQANPAKRRRVSNTQGIPSRPIDSETIKSSLCRITLVLELLEGCHPKTRPQLLKPLSALLNELHHYKSLTGSDLVYLHGLLLSILHDVVEGADEKPDANFDRSAIRIDLIVECVRMTQSAQVHNAALLLMSSLAKWTPDLVLHSVMPLFTFMSSTLLRQHDDYSAHVTDQTVTQIVPQLVKSLKKKGTHLVSGASELLLSFTAAFEHVPLHRRLNLFERLVATLGAEEALSAVIIMLLERYPSDTGLPAFVLELRSCFPPSTSLRASKQYLDIALDGLKTKRSLSDVLLGFNEKSQSDRENSVKRLLNALAMLLSDNASRQGIAAAIASGDDSAEQIRSTYSELLEKTMQLNRDLVSDVDLKEPADALLSSVLGLMPISDFIESSARLMQTGSDETRQQVFHSLEVRAAHTKRGDSASREIFINVLPNCGYFIGTDHPANTRHAAVSCIDQICERFGKTNTSAVLHSARQVASKDALESTDVSLRVISILCLASMVEVLGEEIIPIIPDVLTKTLDYLGQDGESGPTDSRVSEAGFGLLSAVLDDLAWMLSGRTLDRALQVLAAGGPVNKTTGAFLTLAAEKIAPSELFASLDRLWESIIELGPDSIYRHLQVLQHAVEHHPKMVITNQAPILFSILLKAFDLRRQLDRPDSETQDAELYLLVGQIALDMTLKLNDATFRPFFVRMVEWASSLPKADMSGRDLRSISLYSFVATLFEQLKSIVTSYAAFFLHDASEQLKRPPAVDDRQRLLLECVLRALSQIFCHDQDDFWQAPAHFEAVAEALIRQLRTVSLSTATEYVIPAITDLATASDSPENLKAMNNEIMSCMRLKDPAVRLAAVKCERSITERVSFDWLALLPEMLPFISELQEDDDEEVEQETLRWVKQIEDVTGESLEGMLA